MNTEALWNRVDGWLDKIGDKLGHLATLARELGADYFVMALGIFLAYRVVKPNLPLLIQAWERDRRHQRNHERKMEELRASFEGRKARASRKRGKGDGA